MKTPHSFSRNRFSLFLRFTIAGVLLFAAAAMAFVAVNPSGLLAVGKSNSKGIGKPDSRLARSRVLSDHLRTLLGRSDEKNGEGSRLDGPAQEAYDNKAYPAKSIAVAQQRAASNSARAIGRLSSGRSTNWQAIGPFGVPADALVASESTGGSVGTIFS